MKVNIYASDETDSFQYIHVSETVSNFLKCLLQLKMSGDCWQRFLPATKMFGDESDK